MLEELPEDLTALRQRAESHFRNRFGRTPVCCAAAPGRLNLIGEHTDYNDGFVLPMAIDRHAIVAAAPALDNSSRLISADLDEEHHTDFRGELSPEPGLWANYPLGVAAVMKSNGVPLPNVDAVLASSIPIGSGLSSSAAISVAFSLAFEQIAHTPLSTDERIRWCQKAEHEFPGVPCGIMDQTASVCGRAGHAILLDCRSNEMAYVPFPDESEAVLLVANSNVRHELSEDAYGTRWAECRLAAQIIREQLNLQTVEALRDVDPGLLARAGSNLTDALQKRARHVVAENQRTLEAAEALESGRLDRFGDLMYESHDSLRDDFEVSCAELDTLVEGARSFPLEGVYGSRMTGGGFGGCTITLARPGIVESLADHIQHTYRERCQREATVFTVRPVEGGGILT